MSASAFPFQPVGRYPSRGAPVSEGPLTTNQRPVTFSLAR